MIQMFWHSKYKIVSVHLLCWLLFIAMELVHIYSQRGVLEPWYIFGVYYLVNIGLFYLHLVILNHTFSKPGPRLLRGAGWWLLLAAGYFSIKLVLAQLIDQPRPTWTDLFAHLWLFIASASSRGFYFVTLASFYWIAGHLYRARLKNALAAKQLAEAQNAFLRQQINPHLMFNALNFIYSSVYRYSEAGARPVFLLSEIMRYSLRTPEPDGKVDVAAEITQIENLIEINQYRFREPLQLAVEINSAQINGRVLPLVLFTLIENIFKHAKLQEPTARARLSLSQAEGKLILYISDTKKISTAGQLTEGTGLRNTRTRLDFAYGADYELTVREDELHYELHLSLPV